MKGRGVPRKWVRFYGLCWSSNAARRVPTFLNLSQLRKAFSTFLNRAKRSQPFSTAPLAHLNRAAGASEPYLCSFTQFLIAFSNNPLASRHTTHDAYAIALRSTYGDCCAMSFLLVVYCPHKQRAVRSPLHAGDR